MNAIRRNTSLPARAITWAMLAWIIVALAPGLTAQDAKEQSDKQAQWGKLSKKQQRAFRRLHAQLRELPPERRRKLRRRLRTMEPRERRETLRRLGRQLKERSATKASSGGRLDPLERHTRRLRRELLKDLGREERRKLRAIPREERDAYFADLLARSLSGLPRRARARIEQLPPRKQAAALLRFRAGQTTRRTFTNREEIVRLRELSRHDLAAVLGFEDNQVPAEQLELLSAESRERWQALKPYERLRVLRFLSTRDRGSSGKRARQDARR